MGLLLTPKTVLANDKSVISYGKAVEKLFYCPKFKRYDDDAEDYVHLYLCSNSTHIKKGDWVIGGAGDESENELWKDDGTGYISEEDLKVEATTNKKLKLPKIPDWYITHYIGLNGDIKGVEAEINSSKCTCKTNIDICQPHLCVNEQPNFELTLDDGYVNLHVIKELETKAEPTKEIIQAKIDALLELVNRGSLDIHMTMNTPKKLYIDVINPYLNELREQLKSLA